MGILGEDEFIERFLNHVKGYEEVKEIPKNQRHIGRPGLAELLKGTKGRKEISRKAKEAVERKAEPEALPFRVSRYFLW